MENKTNKSFTLIETLVAIAMLVTSMMAPLAVASSSFFQARVARDQVVATYLAQEAIEMVRYVRDRNMIKHLVNDTTDWLDMLPKDVWFEPDWVIAQNGNFSRCPNELDPVSCHYLKYDGAYNFSPAGAETRFKRSVKINVNASHPDEAIVESRVYWTSGVAGERHVSVKVYLYNWAVVE